ncbi:MAG: bifunctional glutamate N-acetyltransferase/amino-acid acetyltransferase ArgJ [Clostridiaceae bacterium]|nr:bifunctional glutamate N-acetyltransferase/amino-acid acetyltransferase ArgJ [Clostridiaceae bacterium]
MKYIEGGVCAAKGFRAGGIHCGIRKNRTKRDLALIASDVRAAAAAVYTTNKVYGAPITVTRENIADGYAQAVIVNSGNANTCNANGIEIAKGMCGLVERYAGIAASDVVVASTGVIGQQMSLDPIASGMPALVAALGKNHADAAEAIMTTDTVPKEAAVEFTVGGRTAHIGGMAKGSGMIHPNMATLLVFITSDVAISPKMLKNALSEDVKDTFNMVSIDGDTSTNDTCAVLSNGLAGNAEITAPGADYEAFRAALHAVTEKLCIMIAKDGEGATKLITCRVTGAKDEQNAKLAAKSIVCSSLVKAAMFGADANWGRELCALGYSGAEMDVSKIGVAFRSRKGTILVCENGVGVDFSEDDAKIILSEDEIDILVTFGDGNAAATAWGCDLTYDYVKINGDYRT